MSAWFERCMRALSGEEGVSAGFRASGRFVVACFVSGKERLRSAWFGRVTGAHCSFRSTKRRQIQRACTTARASSSSNRHRCCTSLKGAERTPCQCTRRIGMSEIARRACRRQQANVPEAVLFQLFFKHDWTPSKSNRDEATSACVCDARDARTLRTRLSRERFAGPLESGHGHGQSAGTGRFAPCAFQTPLQSAQRAIRTYLHHPLCLT